MLSMSRNYVLVLSYEMLLIFSLLHYRQSLLQACRGFQSLFHEAREKAIRAISFAKVLRKDLEIGAEYHFNCEGPEAFLKKLEETKHIRVLASHHTDQLMFVPEYLSNRHKYILQLLDMIVAHDYETPSDFEDNEERDEEHESPEDGYLLVMSYPDGPSPSVSWNGATVRIYPTAENTIALCHLKVPFKSDLTSILTAAYFLLAIII